MKQTNSRPNYMGKTALAVAVAGAISMSPTQLVAQDQQIEEVVVTGIAGSLTRATDIKRNASNIVDSISALDIGKFPDLNVAESLQRITGVSIDRSGGVGQQVTVRGLGPQFNTVLVNGRQIANDSGGREFNFDVLAAEQITGASVYKSTQANLQEGGIGATIVLDTARPFDKPGFYAVGSAKMINETLSGAATPAVSGIVSNTFNDDKMGVLLSVAYQSRDVQINRIETAGWRPGLTLSNRDRNGDSATVNVVADNVYLPRNWDQIVDEQDRTRINANLVLQFAPSDDMTITLDGTYNRFEVDSVATDLASWFEPDRIREATIDPETRTAVKFTQDVDYYDAFGINLDWQINNNLVGVFDIATSAAKNDRAGQDRFNVLGIINSYQFDGTGERPTVTHDGFGIGTAPTKGTDLLRLHYNERGNRPTDEDSVNEIKADFVYTPDGGNIVKTIKFGAYMQSREKSQFQESASQCGGGNIPICGYNIAAPVSQLKVETFTAENYFPGLIDTFYTYDGDAYLDYLANTTVSAVTVNGNSTTFTYGGNDIVVNNGANGVDGDYGDVATEVVENADGTTSTQVVTKVGDSFGINPTLRNNRYTVNEDIFSLYMDYTFEFDFEGMPVTINAGGRYSNTDIEVSAVQAFISDVVPTTDVTLFANRFGTATDIAEGGSYGNFLTNFNVKLELTDDLIFRVAQYDTLTRPTLSQLSPATTFNEPRRQNLTAQGGNPTLQPFQADNFDMALEWYFADSSIFSMTFFRKDVAGFITSITGPETYTLTDRGEDSTVDGVVRCAGDLCGVDAVYGDASVDEVAITEELNGAAEIYTVSRPQNGEDASINGMEIGLSHVFESGFGFIVNATYVDSNANYDPNAEQNLALEGIGNSQNLVLFYETNKFQARIAYNNRDPFLRAFDNGSGTGEPINTARFSQIDLSASFDINDRIQVFFEGINVTEEELVQYGRYNTQFYSIEDNGARFSLGVRANF